MKSCEIKWQDLWIVEYQDSSITYVFSSLVFETRLGRWVIKLVGHRNIVNQWETLFDNSTIYCLQ